MTVLRAILIVLHIVSAALWLGPTLGVSKNLKSSLAAGRESFALAVADFRYRGFLAFLGGTGSLVTGLALIFGFLGGMKGAPIPIHIALGLTLLAIVNSFAFNPIEKALKQAAERYDDASIAAARAAIKRSSMHTHITHT
ncbi:MAG: hypothetical protein U1F43_37960, partial [Myxococcota bacterium]